MRYCGVSLRVLPLLEEDPVWGKEIHLSAYTTPMSLAVIVASHFVCDILYEKASVWISLPSALAFETLGMDLSYRWCDGAKPTTLYPIAWGLFVLLVCAPLVSQRFKESGVDHARWFFGIGALMVWINGTIQYRAWVPTHVVLATLIYTLANTALIALSSPHMFDRPLFWWLGRVGIFINVCDAFHHIDRVALAWLAVISALCMLMGDEYYERAKNQVMRLFLGLGINDAVQRVE
jgi:hypothetical protein